MSSVWFVGFWVFDPKGSRFALPPQEWVIRMDSTKDRLQVDEVITRVSGAIYIQVDAAMDGNFHTFSGSPIANEIAYSVEGTTIAGTARKDGITSFREIMNFPESNVMEMSVSLIVEGRQIELGTARFNRREEAAPS